MSDPDLFALPPRAPETYSQRFFDDVLRRLFRSLSRTSAVRAVYTITNVTPTRTFDANSTTLAEQADTLGTLIADLKEAGVLPR